MDSRGVAYLLFTTVFDQSAREKIYNCGKKLNLLFNSHGEYFDDLFWRVLTFNCFLGVNLRWTDVEIATRSLSDEK